MGVGEFVFGNEFLGGWSALLIIPIYLYIVNEIKASVEKRGKPYEISSEFIFCYNFGLCIMSILLFMLMVRELWEMYMVMGLEGLFCDSQGYWVGSSIYYLYYLNYLMKYIELCDTILLALRGKPIIVLHIYHHAATLVLCWTQLYGETSLQWLVITINLMVHIIMYYYYALQTIKREIWWKRYLTIIQIIQFIIDIIICSIVYLIKVSNLLGIKETGCQGSFIPSTFGILILFSYLALFIQLYYNTYNSTSKSKSIKKQF